MFTRFVRQEFPVGHRGRALLCLGCLGLIGGFALARQLAPNPLGFGTHQQLGLPPCTFRLLFDRPCPACGMTTSFAYFVRGNLRQSLAANPGGALLAAVCLALVPWCACSAAQGRLRWISAPVPAATLVLLVCSVVVGANWILQMYLSWLR